MFQVGDRVVCDNPKNRRWHRNETGTITCINRNIVNVLFDEVKSGVALSGYASYFSLVSSNKCEDWS